MDLSKLSVLELNTLLAQIPKEIDRRQKEEKTKLLKELEAISSERGYTLSELIGAPPKKERVPTLGKYHHPSTPELTWSGRGRQPKWVAEFLQNGGLLEQLQGK